MNYLIVCIVARFVSALTFFSGFGLGTMLMPAFALFFPVPIAVAATAVVHLANNIFKVILIGRKANFSVVWRFAAPATITAMLGAALLILFEKLPPIAEYTLGDQTYQITTVKLVRGLVLAATLAAFFGSFIGKQLLTKVTLRAVQIIIGILLMVVGAGLAIGIL